MMFYSYPINSLFSLLPLFFLLIFSCQKSYRVISHGEIQAAYLNGDYRYIPNLKWVVKTQNRDLGADAMRQLGYFYRDLAIQGKGSQGRDQLTEQELEVFLDLENYFLSNSMVDFDFNLKNIIYYNLRYSSHPQVGKIYEEVLDSSALNNIDKDDPKRENAVAILGFIGERSKWMGEDGFEASLSLCQKGLEISDPVIFAAGLQCWNVLYNRFSDSDSRDRIRKGLSQYLERFENEDEYRHYLLISHPILVKKV